MIMEKIAESHAYFVSKNNKMPSRIRISKSDFKKLMHEKPEAVSGKKILGLVIDMADKGPVAVS